MFLARSKPVPVCDRCGRELAPLSECKNCKSDMAAGGAGDAGLEDLIAAALPASASPQLMAAQAASGPVQPGILHAPSYAPVESGTSTEQEFFAGGRKGSRPKHRRTG